MHPVLTTIGESMPLVSIHNKDTIEQYLRKNTPSHLYELGDLDEFYWPSTTWYALEEAGRVRALALLYTALELPNLLANSEDLATMRVLLQSLLPILPRRFYAHVNGDLAKTFAPEYHFDSHGLHYKMALVDPSCLEMVNTSEVIPLTVAHTEELQSLYNASYPGNWFDARMLETGFYYGIRREDRLVSVAGIHVYSPRYKIGVLGNVTTHPAYRGQGMARATCAKLSQDLLKTVDTIGLNVKADNASAVATYRRLGFEVVGEFEEGLLTSR